MAKVSRKPTGQIVALYARRMGFKRSYVLIMKKEVECKDLLGEFCFFDAEDKQTAL